MEKNGVYNTQLFSGANRRKWRKVEFRRHKYSVVQIEEKIGKWNLEYTLDQGWGICSLRPLVKLYVLKCGL